MQTINIGTEINLADLIQSRMLIQANSGGGKSVTARVIMEESFGKVPFITFDRDGEYYTLKEEFPDIVVIGGSFPDLPISVQSASLLPKEIVSNRLSVVIDLSDLKSAEKQTYVRDFLTALMDLAQSHWTPYLIFIEEAHFFCGEQDKNPAGPAVRELMAGGRKKGYCGVLITQRISKLHKDAAAECNNKFVGRTNLDIDMDRAARELGFNDKEKRLALRDLKPGHFFAYGTSIKPHHVHQVKIKLPRTKQPKAGTVTTIKPGKPTDKVLSALQKLNDLPKEAAKEKKTIAFLQAEISRLKTELTAKPKTTNVEELKSVQSKFFEANRQLEEKDKLIRRYESQRESIAAIIGKPVIDNIPTHNSTPKVVHNPPANVVQPHYNKPEKIKTTNEAKSGNGSLSKCATAILRFLASHADRAWSRVQVAIGSDYSHTSSGFQNAVSELNTKGLINKEGSNLRVNGLSGVSDILGDIEPAPFNLHTFKSKLSKCEGEIYEVLISHQGEALSRENLADQTPSRYSVTSSGFQNAISRLNTLELIKKEGSHIRLNPELLDI